MTRAAAFAVRQTTVGQDQHLARARAGAHAATDAANVAAAERAQARAAAAAGSMAYAVVLGLRRAISTVAMAAAPRTVPRSATMARGTRAGSGVRRVPHHTTVAGVLARAVQRVQLVRRGAARPLAARFQSSARRTTASARATMARMGQWLRARPTTPQRPSAPSVAPFPAPFPAPSPAAVRLAPASVVTPRVGLAREIAAFQQQMTHALPTRPLRAGQAPGAARWRTAMARTTDAARVQAAAAWRSARPLAKPTVYLVAATAAFGPIVPAVAVVYGLDKALGAIVTRHQGLPAALAHRFRRAVARGSDSTRRALQQVAAFGRGTAQRTMDAASHGPARAAQGARAIVAALAAGVQRVAVQRTTAREQRTAYDRWRQGWLRGTHTSREAASDLADWFHAARSNARPAASAVIGGLRTGLEVVTTTAHGLAQPPAARFRRAMTRTSATAQAMAQPLGEWLGGAAGAVGVTALGAAALAGSKSVQVATAVLRVATDPVRQAVHHAYTTGVELRAEAAATQTPLATVTRRAMFARAAVPQPPADLTNAAALPAPSRVTDATRSPAMPRVAASAWNDPPAVPTTAGTRTE